jgi:hypothetical protein
MSAIYRVLLAAFAAAVLAITLGACSVTPGADPEHVARASSALGDDFQGEIPPEGKGTRDLPIGPVGGGGPPLPLSDYGVAGFKIWGNAVMLDDSEYLRIGVNQAGYFQLQWNNISGYGWFYDMTAESFVALGYSEEQIQQIADAGGTSLHQDYHDGSSPGCWPANPVPPPDTGEGCIWAGAAGPLSLPTPNGDPINPASYVLNNPYGDGDFLCTVPPYSIPRCGDCYNPTITTYAWCTLGLPLQPNSGDGQCPRDAIHWWDAAANHFGYLNGFSALPQAGPVTFGAMVSHSFHNGEDDYYSHIDATAFSVCFNEYTHL